MKMRRRDFGRVGGRGIASLMNKFIAGSSWAVAVDHSDVWVNRGAFT
jgi:hypothetical protein